LYIIIDSKYVLYILTAVIGEKSASQSRRYDESVADRAIGRTVKYDYDDSGATKISKYIFSTDG